MLDNDFYFVVDKKLTDNGFKVEIKLNEHHAIYKAHFPEKPITPGVCILQIAKELISNHYQKALMMNEIRNIKFLQVIDPLVDNRVSFFVTTNLMDDGLIKAGIVVENDEAVCFLKISTIYKVL